MSTSTTLSCNPLVLLEPSSSDSLSVHTAITLKASNRSGKRKAEEALGSIPVEDEISTSLKHLNQAYLQVTEIQHLESTLLAENDLGNYYAMLGSKPRSEEDAEKFVMCKEELGRLPGSDRLSIVRRCLKDAVLSKVVCRVSVQSSVSRLASKDKWGFERNLRYVLSLLQEEAHDQLKNTFRASLPACAVARVIQRGTAIQQFERAIETATTANQPPAANGQEPSTAPADDGPHKVVKERVLIRIGEFCELEMKSLYECMKRAIDAGDTAFTEPSTRTGET